MKIFYLALMVTSLLIAQPALAQVLPTRHLDEVSPKIFDYNVRSYGAGGEGRTIDTDAINKAISTAAGNGGGTIYFPSGSYISTSIQLKSNISLEFAPGATLVAATPTYGKYSQDVDYDAPEPAINDKYQDFGHSHFHNSLIWGDHVSNVSIIGKGEIFGKGLVSDYTKATTDGNKAIALVNCQNILIRDITIRHGGWFGILATGVDHLTIDNLIIDTNRDGMDIDCCRDVHVSNCSVNSPHDDGICLKSSFALGYAKPCEDVSITNCHVSGFDEGTFLDGTYGKKGYPTGRIKFGTESNGGFKNIAISNCVFDYSRGLALETVDGALLEDVTISNITMRDIVNAPIFLRLGRRMRGPENAAIGQLHRVSISNVRVIGAREACIIAGIPGHPIQGISLSDIRFEGTGGAPASQAEAVPKEDEKGYPEPESLGKMPAYGFYVRHAQGIDLNDIRLTTSVKDGRPPFVFDDVADCDLTMVEATRTEKVPLARLKSIRNLRLRMSAGLRDNSFKFVASGKV